MGELRRRLDKTRSFTVAKPRVELWMSEFVAEYVAAPAKERLGVVKRWFG